MREIQMWDNKEGLKRTFEDIEALAAQCRFSDCRHDTEPGCAVRAALEDGSLDPGRFKSYLKLQKELRHLALRQNEAEARREARKFDRKIRQYHRDVKEMRKKGLA
jgi:ribosome biogenesis GTPase